MAQQTINRLAFLCGQPPTQYCRISSKGRASALSRSNCTSRLRETSRPRRPVVLDQTCFLSLSAFGHAFQTLEDGLGCLPCGNVGVGSSSSIISAPAVCAEDLHDLTAACTDCLPAHSRSFLLKPAMGLGRRVRAAGCCVCCLARRRIPRHLHIFATEVWWRRRPSCYITAVLGNSYLIRVRRRPSLSTGSPRPSVLRAPNDFSFGMAHARRSANPVMRTNRSWPPLHLLLPRGQTGSSAFK